MAMSSGSRTVMPIEHPSNKRDMHPETKVSIIFIIHSTSDLDLHNLKVVWHKEVIGILPVLIMVGITQVSVLMTP